MFRSSLFAVALIPLMFSKAAAQQPSQAQRDAVRASCRSDFIANCSGVQPGGREAIECLQLNLAKLSASCRAAVTAISAPAAPAAGAPKTTERPAAATATPPPSAPAVSAPPASAAPAMGLKPTAEQKHAVREACRSDFVALCPRVKPGGTAAIRCLQRNGAQLSEACRSAVTAIGGTNSTAPPAAAPAQAAPPAVPAPATAGFPPLGPVRPMLPRRALAILAICRADQGALCAGVPPGGGRVLDCLAANAPRLSAQCYKALAPVTQ